MLKSVLSSTTQISAIIIDDEERARAALSSLLEKFCPEVTIVASCANVPDGVLAINKLRPMLVFLDIDMPEYNGFELLNFFREVDFEIIFVTAYNEFALKAFEVSAVDYLLKPVDIDKLKAAITKASQRLGSSQITDKLEVLKSAFSSNPFTKIALPLADGLHFVNTNDIMYLEADGAYTEVWLNDGSKQVVSKKLKFFEDILEKKPNYFRSHRSYIVNINYVKKYSKSDNLLLLDNGKTLLISRERKSDFENQLKENNITVG